MIDPTGNILPQPASVVPGKYFSERTAAHDLLFAGVSVTGGGGLWHGTDCAKVSLIHCNCGSTDQYGIYLGNYRSTNTRFLMADCALGPSTHQTSLRIADGMNGQILNSTIDGGIAGHSGLRLHEGNDWIIANCTLRGRGQFGPLCSADILKQTPQDKWPTLASKHLMAVRVIGCTFRNGYWRFAAGCSNIVIEDCVFGLDESGAAFSFDDGVVRDAAGKPLYDTKRPLPQVTFRNCVVSYPGGKLLNKPENAANVVWEKCSFNGRTI